MARSKQPRVLVIGELNVDIVAAGLKGPPRMGAEILTGDVAITLGSASAIFASGMAKLGHPVTFISQVGIDYFGEFCVKALNENGVSTEHVYHNPDVKTGATLALSGHHDRALVTYPGAIATFSAKQVDRQLLKGHDHLHMTSYFLQDQLRPSFPQILREARELGLTTSFDPNSDPTSSWSKSIRSAFRNSDVLFLNHREALELTKAGNLKSAFKHLGKLVPCAVIKTGAKGAQAIQGNAITRAPGFKVNAVDTTGAGDSFDAGFISAYLRHESLIECLRQGNACGALSTLKPGGTAAQPTAAQLRKFLRAGQK